MTIALGIQLDVITYTAAINEGTPPGVCDQVRQQGLQPNVIIQGFQLKCRNQCVQNDVRQSEPVMASVFLRT